MRYIPSPYSKVAKASSFPSFVVARIVYLSLHFVHASSRKTSPNWILFGLLNSVPAARVGSKSLRPIRSTPFIGSGIQPVAHGRSSSLSCPETITTPPRFTNALIFFSRSLFKRYLSSQISPCPNHRMSAWLRGLADCDLSSFGKRPDCLRPD